MKKNKVYEFDPIIYPRKLWVVVKPDIEDLNQEFEGIPSLDESDSAVVYHAYNKKKNLGGVLIVFKDKSGLTTSNITHESIHGAMIILQYVGVRLDYNNQEPLTYLAGWIADCISKMKISR